MTCYEITATEWFGNGVNEPFKITFESLYTAETVFSEMKNSSRYTSIKLKQVTLLMSHR